MVVEIFGMGLSAPCRILHMTCEALGVEYKETNVDLFKGENKTPEFLKVLYLYFLFHITICHVYDDFICNVHKNSICGLINKHVLPIPIQNSYQPSI